MIHSLLERLVVIVRQSIFAGIVYSIFEGIYLFLYLDFPLFSVYWMINTSLKNIAVFLVVGLLAYGCLSLMNIVFRGFLSDITPIVFLVLILFPVYFFLLSIEETDFIYRYLKSPKTIALLLIIPPLLLLGLFPRFIKRKYIKRCFGLTVSIFFFINLGYLYIEWRPLFKGSFSSFISLLAVLGIVVAIYFTVVKVRETLLGKEDSLEQTVNLRRTLLVALCLGFMSFLWIMYYGFKPLEPRSFEGKPNILLIVLDTARSDRFSCYGYWRDTTPFLRDFCKTSNLYSEAISPSPWTMPSHASIFTGLYPSAHGLERNGFSLDEDFLTLSEYLAAKGYVTIGFCNNQIVNPGSGLAQGFEHYVEMWNKDISNPSLFHKVDWFLRRFMGRNDGGALRTNQWVMEWLKSGYKADRPFFIFINLMECHLKYDGPDNYHKKYLRENYSLKPLAISEANYTFFTGLDEMTKEEWQDYSDIYDGDVFYLDERLGDLCNFLEDNSYFDNTVIIITGDHGDLLGEHKLTGHILSLYEPLLTVPLVIKVPHDLQELAEVEGPVQTVDIFPTLVELLGGDAGSLGHLIQGISLVHEEKQPHDFVISELEPFKEKIKDFIAEYPEGTALLKFDRSLKSIRMNSLKYIWSPEGDAELFDLSVDPGELRNILENRREEAEILEGKLMDWLASFEHPGEAEGEIELDAETRRRLKALGYIN